MFVFWLKHYFLAAVEVKSVSLLSSATLWFHLFIHKALSLVFPFVTLSNSILYFNTRFFVLTFGCLYDCMQLCISFCCVPVLITGSHLSFPFCILLHYCACLLILFSPKLGTHMVLVFQTDTVEKTCGQTSFGTTELGLAFELYLWKL